MMIALKVILISKQEREESTVWFNISSWEIKPRKG